MIKQGIPRVRMAAAASDRETADQDHAPTQPEAGKGREFSRRELVKLIRAAGHKVDYQSSSEKKWHNVLKRAGDIVAVAGGDGTVGKVARRLIGSLVESQVSAGGEHQRRLFGGCYCSLKRARQAPNFLSERLNGAESLPELASLRGRHLQIECETSPVHIDDIPWPSDNQPVRIRSHAISIKIDPDALIFLIPEIGR